MSVPFGLWPFDPRQVEWFFLAVARLAGLLAVAPPFSHRGVPVTVRVGLGVALAGLAWSAIAAAPPPPSTSGIALGLRAAGELVVGLLVGFIGQLFAAAATFAGELLGTKMGFGLARVIDPTHGGQVTVVTHLFDLLVLLLFLTLGGHLIVVAAAVESFRLIPLATWSLNPTVLESLFPLVGRIFTLGFALAAPTLGAVFLANLVLVLIARSIPQINILLVGFPLMIMVGLVVLLLNLDLTGVLLAGEVNRLEGYFVDLLRALAHGR